MEIGYFLNFIRVNTARIPALIQEREFRELFAAIAIAFHYNYVAGWGGNVLR